ncbi:hypothetical protein EYF80_031550 [Liparis tanakae]|uniref:Uncharacterized protein n=1 Tax=Liparis tanakae TaxID=230148 RepID=A0A4Z2GXD3_9TELE|nr:hypothetical protein EYF80_031550 [Liparis tanakae]
MWASHHRSNVRGIFGIWSDVVAKPTSKAKQGVAMIKQHHATRGPDKYVPIISESSTTPRVHHERRRVDVTVWSSGFGGSEVVRSSFDQKTAVRSSGPRRRVLRQDD